MERVLSKTNLTKDDIDYFVLDQVNKLMLEFLQMKCDLIGYPFWNDVKEYGNTVSCLIFITLVDMFKANEDKNIQKVLSVGFGVSLSWVGCLINLSMIWKI